MAQMFRTGDEVERVGMGSTAVEIDRLLCELGQLYIQRTQAIRMGTHLEIQAISAKINALKIKLNQL